MKYILYFSVLKYEVCVVDINKSKKILSSTTTMIFRHKFYEYGKILCVHAVFSGHFFNFLTSRFPGFSCLCRSFCEKKNRAIS